MRGLTSLAWRRKVRRITAREDSLLTHWRVGDPTARRWCHVIERFGIGPRGKVIDDDGWYNGWAKLIDGVAPGDEIHLTVFIGARRVEHGLRVFDVPLLLSLVEPDCDVLEAALVGDSADAHTPIDWTSSAAARSFDCQLGSVLLRLRRRTTRHGWFAVTPARLRRAREHCEMPEIPAELCRPGAVWGVTMVKDEADVIEAVLRHQVAQGIEAVLVADNGSRDGTSDILRRLSGELPLVVASDSLVAYDQAAKITRLSRLAVQAGAGWVVPFDADEFWYGAGGVRLATALAALPEEIAVVEAALHNAFPVRPIGPDSPLITTPCRVCAQPAADPKVAYRGRWEAILAPGNHDVSLSGARAGAASILHLPWRSHEQLARKVGHGVVAVEAAGQGEGLAHHWRAIERGGAARVAAAWAGILAGREDPELMWTPRGPLVETTPFDPSTTDWTSAVFAADGGRRSFS